MLGCKSILPSPSFSYAQWSGKKGKHQLCTAPGPLSLIFKPKSHISSCQREARGFLIAPLELIAQQRREERMDALELTLRQNRYHAQIRRVPSLHTVLLG